VLEVTGKARATRSQGGKGKVRQGAEEIEKTATHKKKSKRTSPEAVVGNERKRRVGAVLPLSAHPSSRGVNHESFNSKHPSSDERQHPPI